MCNHPSISFLDVWKEAICWAEEDEKISAPRSCVVSSQEIASSEQQSSPSLALMMAEIMETLQGQQKAIKDLASNISKMNLWQDSERQRPPTRLQPPPPRTGMTVNKCFRCWYDGRWAANHLPKIAPQGISHRSLGTFPHDPCTAHLTSPPCCWEPGGRREQSWLILYPAVTWICLWEGSYVGSCPVTTVKLGGVPVRYPPDSGSQVSTINESFFNQHFYSRRSDLLDTNKWLTLTTAKLAQKDLISVTWNLSSKHKMWPFLREVFL